MKIIIQTIILVAVFIFDCNVSYTQSFSWEWAKSGNGNANDRNLCSTTDNLGNVYIAGWFESDSISFDGITLYNNGMRNVYVIKYDKFGNVEWGKSATGTGYYEIKGIVADQNNNIFITGYYGYFGSPNITFGTTTLTRQGGDDIFLVKYDSNGSVLWAKSEGGSGYDYGKDITIDNDGNIYVTGYFRNSEIILGTDTISNPSSAEDVLIIKYDNNGNVLWGRSAGSFNGYDYSYSVAVDLSKNVYLTGFAYNSDIIFASDTLVSQGNYDMFVLKYNQNGNEEWIIGAGGSEYDYGFCLTTDNFGNIYLSGEIQSASIVLDTITLTNPGFYVAKYNSTGNIIWAKNTNCINSSGQGITIDVDNNIYISGIFSATSITFETVTLTNSSSTNEIFLVKYDSNGSVIWGKSAGGTSSDESYDVSSDLLGNIYVTGYYWTSPIHFDTITLSNLSGSDVCIAKVGFRLENIEHFNLTCNSSSDGIINISAYGGASQIQYSIDGGNSFYSNNSFINLVAGFYPIVITDGVDTIVCNIIELTEPLSLNVYLGNDTTIMNNQSITLNAGAGFNTYQWNDGSTDSTMFIDGSSTSIGVHEYFVIVSDTNSCYDSDTILVTIDDYTAINEKLTELIIVYPNPTTGIVSVTGKNIEYIEISDIEGKLLNRIECMSERINIDLSARSKGIYMIKIVTDKGIVIEKIVLK
ncbi:MAG: SBBP repeat-containing protein [Bacteroidales bacterium]|nr:SBBP repeat-containing protein [Bacteroidales bacterium]